MGLFSSKREETFPWVKISSIDQLNEILLNSTEKPLLLFKHSTRCGVSSMALNSFENYWTNDAGFCDLYLIDLLRHRDVSNEIEKLTGVVHQSPQVIVIREKDIIYDATHSAIDGRKIESILKKG